MGNNKYAEYRNTRPATFQEPLTYRPLADLRRMLTDQQVRTLAAKARVIKKARESGNNSPIFVPRQIIIRQPDPIGTVEKGSLFIPASLKVD